MRHAEVLEVLENNEVGALARRDGAQVARHAKAVRHVDGDHLDGRDGIDAKAHGLAQNAVEVSLGDQGLGMVVVGDEVNVARVDVVVGDNVRELLEVLPGRALAQLRVLAQAELRERLVARDGLVAAGDSGGNVGVELAISVWHREVAGQGLVGLERLVHLGERALVAGEDTGVVHHLAKANHGVPPHGLADVLVINLRTGVLKAWNRGDAGSRRDHALERHALGVADELLQRGKPGDVHGLVRVPVDSRGTVRNHRAGVLGRPHHGGLNVDVTVHEARRHKAAGSIDDGGLLANAVLCRVTVNAQVGNAPSGNGDVCVVENLVRGDAYQPCMANDEVGGLLTLGHTDERAIAFPQRRLAEAIEHGSPSRHPAY